MRPLRVQWHPYGPRVWVLGRRWHHFHSGLALIAYGARLIWRDRRDLLGR